MIPQENSIRSYRRLNPTLKRKVLDVFREAFYRGKKSYLAAYEVSKILGIKDASPIVTVLFYDDQKIRFVKNVWNPYTKRRARAFRFDVNRKGEYITEAVPEGRIRNERMMADNSEEARDIALHRWPKSVRVRIKVWKTANKMGHCMRRLHTPSLVVDETREIK